MFSDNHQRAVLFVPDVRYVQASDFSGARVCVKYLDIVFMLTSATH